MVRFAISTYGRFIANYCTWNLDNLLVGWRFGPVSLGFYKKAYDLFALSTSQLVAPLTSVAVSALSRLNPKSKEFRRSLLGALEMTAFVGMAVGADLTRPQLMPGLRGVQHHAALVEGLERPGDVGRNLGEEAGVRIAVGVERLASRL